MNNSKILWQGNTSSDTAVKRLRTQFVTNSNYLIYKLHFLTEDSGSAGIALNVTYDRNNHNANIYLQVTSSSGTQTDFQIL